MIIDIVTRWKHRTRFFTGPFTENDGANPDDFDLPMFAIGSLLDGYRDAAVDIFQRLKAKGVRTKLAMSPSSHTLPDEASPGPRWEWRQEVKNRFSPVRLFIFGINFNVFHCCIIVFYKAAK